MGLRLKIYSPLLITGVLLLASIHCFLLPHIENQERSEHIEHLHSHLATLAASLGDRVRNREFSEIESVLGGIYKLNPGWHTFELRNQSDTVIFHDEVSNDVIPSDFLLSMEYPLTHDGEPLAMLQVQYNMQPDIDRLRDKFSQYESTVFAFIIVLLMLFAVVMELTVLRPVRQLRKAAAAVADKNYMASLPAAGSDEMGKLITEFGRMRDAIANYATDMELRVAERVAAESALGKMNEHLENLVSERTLELQNQKSALDEHSIVAITDRAGQIIYVNDKFCEISKYCHNELIGENHRILNSGTHPREFFVDMWRTISRGKVWKGEICNRAKDGGLYWVASTIVPFLDEQGRPYQYVAIRTDITERIKQEEQIRLAHEAALAANRVKDEFLAGMSHEIRTPMNGIVGVMDILEDTDLTAEQEEYVSIARNATMNLLDMLNQTLDYSKMESNRLELEEIEIDPKMFCLDIYNFYHQKAVSKSLALQLDTDETLPDCVMGDPVRVRQILGNLLDNAIKFTAKGTIHLRARLQIMTGQSCTIRFEVSDSGIGIPPEQQQKIFEAFKQADSSITRQYGGTGLGLAIVKKLVIHMQGEIGLTSEPDAGTTFFIELPFVLPVAGSRISNLYH